jgi:tRNA threonylcarbamoyl adenosine modification protein (Sua5/YciO/YrdC/YwlC family)
MSERRLETTQGRRRSIALKLSSVVVVSVSVLVSMIAASQGVLIHYCQAFQQEVRRVTITNSRKSHLSFVRYLSSQRYNYSSRQQQQQQTMMGIAQHHQVSQHNADETAAISRTVSSSTPRAKIVPSTELEKCGERLRQGDLVAFPTETVYGLGCNAMDPKAIIKVFQAKERPLTDPLITHVTENEVAYNLWEADTSNSNTLTSLEGHALRVLCEQFWPGPLTLVAKAAPHVPSILMANTGFVACRAPQHPISIALINAAKVPIAAPSANKFGHVSPTRSHHVWDDLQYEDVWIVKEDQEGENENDESADENNSTTCCQVGVESSVAKIEMLTPEIDDRQPAVTSVKGRITLLRQGAISVEDIQECLEHAGLANDFEVLARTKKATDETVAHVAPGQTIRHYSPHIPSFILCQSLIQPSSLDDNDKAYLAKSVLIDFGGKVKAWESFSLAYRDLSESGDSSQATKGVFETLRWAECVDGAEQILFPEIHGDGHSDPGAASNPDALTLALKDRLTRAASGVVIHSLG